MIESTSGSDAEAEQWCLIESDPDVFTKLIREYGCKGVQVKELQSLEPEEFVDLRPVHGLFILFKWEPNQELIGSSVLDAEADIIFFAQQVITNAFATQAILSILLNCKHPDVTLGSTLTEFKEYCQSFDATTKGSSLSRCQAIRKVHNSFAKPTSFELDSKSQNKNDETYHFVCYVPIDGKVYEIDELKAGPIDSGIIPPNSDWLSIAKPVIENRIKRYNEGGIHFNLMAIVEHAAEIDTNFFEKILKSPTFVDKSLMIEKIIHSTEVILLTAPRRFGKSSNLDMVRRFFDVSTNQADFNFDKLRLGVVYPRIVSEHCGKYTVLWTDFSWYTVAIDSLKETITAVRQIVHKTYQQYTFLCSSPKLTTVQREICKEWCCDKTYRTLDEMSVGDGLKNLASYLRAHYEKKIVLCVDEFDSIINDAMFRVSRNELHKIIRYYYKLFSIIVKTGRSEPLPFRAIFTSVIAVTCSDPSPLNNMKFFKFLENDTFAEFYGILVPEFENLLKKKEFSALEIEKQKAISFYNGYTSNSKQILCTNSIVCYMTSNDTERLKSYWQMPVSIRGFSKLWQRKEVEIVLSQIVRGDTVNVSYLVTLTPDDLYQLGAIFSQKNEKESVMPYLSVLLRYLQQLGYFTIVSKSTMNMSLRVPNEEIRLEFQSMYATRYLSQYKYNEALVSSCALCFEELFDILQSNNFDEVFEKISEALKKACEECLERDSIDEATFARLVFAVILKTSFQPTSQRYIKSPGEKSRHSKRLDLCFRKYDIGFVIELMTEEKQTAANAVDEIMNNRYYIFNNEIDSVKNCICIGMHLDKKTLVVTIQHEIHDMIVQK